VITQALTGVISHFNVVDLANPIRQMNNLYESIIVMDIKIINKLYKISSAKFYAILGELVSYFEYISGTISLSSVRARGTTINEND
jgi:hypothetical protein